MIQSSVLQMKRTFYFSVIALALVGYNLFLIDRDKKMFESYNRCLTEECRK